MNQTEVAKSQYPASRINPGKVMARASLSLVFIIGGYFAPKIYPAIDWDWLQALVATGSLACVLWGLKAGGDLRGRYFWLFVATLLVAPILARYASHG